MRRERVEADNDPLSEALRPGGLLGNHGRDAHFEGLRLHELRVEDRHATLRGSGGSGWLRDSAGTRRLYPSVGTARLRVPVREFVQPEIRALHAWLDDGVPLRLRSFVGHTPVLVLDDGWRSVQLPRAGVNWWVAPA